MPGNSKKPPVLGLESGKELKVLGKSEACYSVDECLESGKELKVDLGTDFPKEVWRYLESGKELKEYFRHVFMERK